MPKAAGSLRQFIPWGGAHGGDLHSGDKWHLTVAVMEENLFLKQLSKFVTFLVAH